jgi:hypothetical protein
MVQRGERWADLEHEFNLAGRGRSNLAIRLKWMKLNARGGPGAPPAPPATQGQAATTAPVVNGLNEVDDDDDEMDVDEDGNDDDEVSFVDDDEMTGDDAEEHPAAQPHPTDLAMEARKEAAVSLMALTSGNQHLVPLPTPAASSSSATTTPATISFTPINRPVRAAPCVDLFKMEFDFIMSPIPTPVLSNVRAEPFEPKAWAHGPPRSFEAACGMRA